MATISPTATQKIGLHNTVHIIINIASTDSNMICKTIIKIMMNPIAFNVSNMEKLV